LNTISTDYPGYLAVFNYINAYYINKIPLKMGKKLIRNEYKIIFTGLSIFSIALIALSNSGQAF
jgi:hypothetical protein